MHEVALAHSIVEIAEAQARAAGSPRVTKVFLRIGALAHVDPAALAFGFEAVSGGTRAAGAELIIERGPAKALCIPCGLELEVASHVDVCPRCGIHQWMLTEGDEMRVTELEVE
jgi:hydrogenase nickel incorporation protein HypA/HybF